MANRIFGMVSDSARGGMPLRDLRVRVWDQDWPDGDDLLGEAMTTSDGRYEVRFPASRWDLPNGIFNLNRPDIYITAESMYDAGKWVRLGESEVNRNHDMSQDLRIDLDMNLGDPVSKHTNFISEIHGFHFENSFPVTPDLLGIDLGEWKMGFCGGMCSGALYRFRNSIAIVEDSEAPSEGNPLYSELKKRQIRSMSPKMLPKMFEWQCSPDTRQSRRKQGIGERTREGWPELKAAIDEGQPTNIVLIRAAGLLGNPTDNHQVLVTGYEFNPLTMDLVLLVYDPNIPGITQTISLNLGLPDGRLGLIDSASPKTRGFFVNPMGEAAVTMGDFDLG